MCLHESIQVYVHVSIQVYVHVSIQLEELQGPKVVAELSHNVYLVFLFIV